MSNATFDGSPNGWRRKGKGRANGSCHPRELNAWGLGDDLRAARTDAQIRAAFPCALFATSPSPDPPPTIPYPIPSVMVPAPDDPEDDLMEAFRSMSVAQILAHISDASAPTMPPAMVPSPLPSPPAPSPLPQVRLLWHPPLPPGPPPSHVLKAVPPPAGSYVHYPPL